MIALQFVEILVCVFMIVFCEGNATMDNGYPLTKHLFSAAYLILIFWQLFSFGMLDFMIESRREEREERDKQFVSALQTLEERLEKQNLLLNQLVSKQESLLDAWQRSWTTIEMLANQTWKVKQP